MITIKYTVGIFCLGSWSSELCPQSLGSLQKRLGLIFSLEATKQHSAETARLGLVNWSVQSYL